ncbi:hypothetical protein B0H19DRAFT_1068050 [Mycena capillaripes]|nr:hypothetical protein B0H19DRAFT_1068050 [Mycena capillaripes]
MSKVIVQLTALSKAYRLPKEPPKQGVEVLLSSLFRRRVLAHCGRQHKGHKYWTHFAPPSGCSSRIMGANRYLMRSSIDCVSLLHAFYFAFAWLLYSMTEEFRVKVGSNLGRGFQLTNFEPQLPWRTTIQETSTPLLTPLICSPSAVSLVLPTNNSSSLGINTALDGGMFDDNNQLFLSGGIWRRLPGMVVERREWSAIGDGREIEAPQPINLEHAEHG